MDVVDGSSLSEEDEDDLLLRRVVLCEEDRRRLFPLSVWAGGYRWFRSPNIVDLEVRRKAKESKKAA
jgi:hypothetical protein